MVDALRPLDHSASTEGEYWKFASFHWLELERGGDLLAGDLTR